MKTKIRQLIFMLPALLLFASFAGDFITTRVYAAPIPTPDGGSGSTTTNGFNTGLDQHLDRSTIFYDGNFYFDSKIDDDYTYFNQDDEDACPDEIDNLHDDNQHATLHVKTKSKTNGGCDETSKKDNITLAFTNRALMPFHFLDNETIITSDRQNTYTKDASNGLFYENDGDNCKDTIKVTTGPGTGGATVSLTANTGGDNTSYDSWAQEMDFKSKGGHDSGNGCYSYEPQSYKASTVYLYNTELAGNSPASSTATLSTDSSAGSPDIDCGLGAANWIFCPVQEAIEAAVSKVDGIINNLLEIDTDAIFKDCASTQSSTNCETSTAYHTAWASMRNIALGLLVIGALVMIISQALGYEFIDAYTIKKVLPRIIIAAIGISLSWILLKFFVDLTNDIGNGIRNLIYTPFSRLDHSIALGWSGNIALTIFVGVKLYMLGLAAFALIGTALLAAFVAVMVLIIRQVLIVFLILVAPIAIVAYILPNTKNIYDIWWDFFAKALMMFPFIAAFIATGRVFSQVASTQAHSSSSGVLSGAIFNIVAFIAYFAPYLLLPLAFRFAGGALRSIGGFVNDKSRGGFDRLKNIRQQSSQRRAQELTKRAKEGNFFRYAEAGSRTDRINKRLQQASHLNQARYRRGQFGASVESAIGDTNLEAGLEAAEKLPGARSFFASDNLMIAGAEGKGDFQKTYNSLIEQKWTPEQARLGAAQAVRLRSQMGAQAFDLTAAAKLPGTGTYAEEGDIGKWHELVAKASGGNKSLQATLIAQGKSGFRSAQRYEVSEAGFGDHLEAVAMAERGVDAGKISDFIVDKALAGGGAAAVVGSRNQKSAKMFAEAVKRMLKTAADSGDRGEQLRALALAANIQDQMAGGKKIVTDVLAKEVFGDDTINGKTVLQLIADVRDLPEFQQARRELGRDIPPSIQAAQARASSSTQTPGSTPQPPVGGGLQPPL